MKYEELVAAAFSTPKYFAQFDPLAGAWFVYNNHASFWPEDGPDGYHIESVKVSPGHSTKEEMLAWWERHSDDVNEPYLHLSDEIIIVPERDGRG